MLDRSADPAIYRGRSPKPARFGRFGYPEKLEWLYEGFDIGDAKGTKIKYLRRLPRDPMTGGAEWGTRSSRDRPESSFTDGTNIFDVHTTSEAVALDGTPYAEW